MVNSSEVMTVLKKAKYTDIQYLDGVYIARNVLGYSRIFRPQLLMSSPIEVYAIKPIDLDIVDFNTVVDIKMILLDFKEMDENNKLKHIIKLQDFFYEITEEQSKLISDTYDNVEFTL